MDNGKITEKIVREANRRYFDEMDISKYKENKSLFSSTAQKRIKGIIEKIMAGIRREEMSEPACFLDIGCGTGNLLALAGEMFDLVFGIDLSFKCLSFVREREKQALLILGDALSLPFKEKSFHCVALYAVLHHVVNYQKLVKDAGSLVKKGGFIYLDHEPNYYLMRYLVPLRRLKRYFSKRPLTTGEIAEYRHWEEPGIQGEEVKKLLAEMGFRNISLVYRFTDRAREFRGLRRIVIRLLKLLDTIIPRKYCATHFYVTAEK